MKSKEWDGIGLPPTGTVCEYYWSEGDGWRKCKIVAYYFANVVAVDVLDCTAVLLRADLFRPIRTPEQIAVEERQQTIDKMMHLAVVPGRKYKDVMAYLYDAGYRIAEVKK